MTSLLLYYILAGISLLVIFLSGTKIRQIGIPYRISLIAIHKLASLTLLAVVVMIIRLWNDSAPISTSAWVLIGVVGFIKLLIIISGGMLAYKNESNPTLAVLHKITAFLAVILLLVLLYTNQG